MGGFEIPRARLDALIKLVGTYGVTVSEDWNEPEGARFIGTFAGTHITLYPKFDPQFALLFTVAHLYGHMVQIVLDSPRSRAATALVSKGGHFTHQEIQLIYDHEREAACIGRTLLGQLGDISRAEDQQYCRLFLADFHYLIHFLESQERGTEAFARFLRREPVPVEVLAADPRPLLDLHHASIINPEVVVV